MKEIERIGIPVVHIANMTPIAEMVGSNRIVKGTSIVCPLGDHNLTKDKEIDVRRKILTEALESLQMSKHDHY